MAKAGKGRGKGGGGKGGGGRAARPDLSEEEIEDLKAEFAMLQEEFEAQMAASEESMFEGVWDFSKSDDVQKADQAIAQILKSFVQERPLQPRHQRRISVPPASPAADVSRRQPAFGRPLFARRINEAEKERQHCVGG